MAKVPGSSTGFRRGREAVVEIFMVFSSKSPPSHGKLLSCSQFNNLLEATQPEEWMLFLLEAAQHFHLPWMFRESLPICACGKQRH